jgi:hypothetical protein
LKSNRKLASVFSVIFGILFAASTSVYSEASHPITKKIGYYGLPFPWLKATTAILPPSPTQYSILWLELIMDIIFYLSLSVGLSLVILTTLKHSEAPEESPVWNRVFLTVLVAYSTRLISCGIHELLGHGLWAFIFGADKISVQVSWLGFGWCSWEGAASSYTARVLIHGGGLLNTSLVGALLLTFLSLALEKGGFYVRFSVFWLGFWAVITQAGYLLLGGLARWGDPSMLSGLTGIPLFYFALFGFILFIIAYFVVSILFLLEIAELFPEYGQKVLLSEFWLTVPMQMILFSASPQHPVSTWGFISLFSLSIVPSLLSTQLFPLFQSAKRKVGARSKNGA